MTIAFFPGKFQPPHTGHYMTISKLLREYTKVIVGISGDIPEGGRVCTRDAIEEIFSTIFAGMRIEIMHYHGSLTGHDSLEDLPKFDVLITAENYDVFSWANKMNVKVKMVDRSNVKGVQCDGTEMRKLYG